MGKKKPSEEGLLMNGYWDGYLYSANEAMPETDPVMTYS